MSECIDAFTNGSVVSSCRGGLSHMDADLTHWWFRIQRKATTSASWVVVIGGVVGKGAQLRGAAGCAPAAAWRPSA